MHAEARRRARLSIALASPDRGAGVSPRAYLISPPSVRAMAADDAILVRMSKEQKAELKGRAADAGLTVRAYALHKLLDISDLPTGKPGRQPRTQDELPITKELRMTG